MTFLSIVTNISFYTLTSNDVSWQARAIPESTQQADVKWQGEHVLWLAHGVFVSPGGVGAWLGSGQRTGWFAQKN
jgi:hypothetical protein